MLRGIVNKIKNNPEEVLWGIATLVSPIGYGLGQIPLSLFFYSAMNFSVSSIEQDEQSRYCLNTFADVGLYLFSQNPSLTMFSKIKFGYDVVRWWRAEQRNKAKEIVDKKNEGAASSKQEDLLRFEQEKPSYKKLWKTPAIQVTPAVTESHTAASTITPRISCNCNNE